MSLAPGTRLGPYEIVAPLGAGGMGEVYRARDTKLGREVALKVLPEAFAADAERMARFEREAKVLASLNHPNIATIHGLEESNGLRALVMELVEGPTLADLITRGPIPLDEALPVAKQIAEGLEYAHERGIIHRDLKPANIKITPDGAVKLLDFGLAKALESESASGDISTSPTISRMATQAGIILGTAAYMAPEQTKGRPVDRRADIWAFGCVFYEMLTGKQVFTGETITDVLAVVVLREPDWSTLPTATPPHVRVLLQRCMQKNPKQRLQAIGDARIALDEVISGTAPQPAEAAPAETTTPLRHRVLPWGLAAVFSVLASIFAFAYFRGSPATASQSAMHFSAVTNFAGVQADPALSPDGRSVAFVSNRDGDFNIYVGLINGGNLVQITQDSNLESAPSWSPDGTALTYTRADHEGVWDIWTVPALGGTPRRLILNATDPTWSPDGRSLAYVNLADGGIWISGISNENAHQAVPPGNLWKMDTQPKFSPDGRRIAFAARTAGSPYGELAVADLDSGRTDLLTHDNALALSPAWSPDGRFIYFASSRAGTINIWKIAAAGDTPEQITAGEGDDADLDVSKDGKRIIFGTIRQRVGLVQLDLRAKPGQPSTKTLTTDPARNLFGPAYSPDGKRLAYFTNLKGVEHETIWISDADGSNAAPLVQDERANVFPAWSPNSKDIIYASAKPPQFSWEYRQMPLSGGAPQSLIVTPHSWIPDIGRDGRALIRGSKNQIEALDPRDGRKQTLGVVPAPARGLMEWSPDERAVAYVVNPQRQDDPNAGLWVDDFKNPPRQIFRGWVVYFARGPGNKIYLLEGRPDLTAVLWKVNWNGQGLTRTSWTVPILYKFNYYHTALETQIDVSPDGRYLAFTADQVLQENIGMIENVR